MLNIVLCLTCICTGTTRPHVVDSISTLQTVRTRPFNEHIKQRYWHRSSIEYDMASRSPQESHKKRVAVIGAGAAGLIAAKYVTSTPLTNPTDTRRYLLAEGLHVTLYERMSEVGGVWYSYDQMFPTNAYDNLETNIPRHLMTFSGQPWPTSTPIFPGKDIVAGYLRCLADDLLNKHSDDFRLQLHTEVTNLLRVFQSKNVMGWKITARTWEADHVFEETNEFGLVVVSTGIYTKEFIPASYKGIQSWRESYGDTESHSKTFRNAGNFKYKVCHHFLHSSISTDK